MSCLCICFHFCLFFFIWQRNKIRNFISLLSWISVGSKPFLCNRLKFFHFYFFPFQETQITHLFRSTGSSEIDPFFFLFHSQSLLIWTYHSASDLCGPEKDPRFCTFSNNCYHVSYHFHTSLSSNAHMM